MRKAERGRRHSAGEKRKQGLCAPFAPGVFFPGMGEPSVSARLRRRKAHAVTLLRRLSSQAHLRTQSPDQRQRYDGLSAAGVTMLDEHMRTTVAPSQPSSSVPPRSASRAPLLCVSAQKGKKRRERVQSGTARDAPALHDGLLAAGAQLSLRGSSLSTNDPSAQGSRPHCAGARAWRRAISSSRPSPSPAPATFH